MIFFTSIFYVYIVLMINISNKCCYFDVFYLIKLYVKGANLTVFFFAQLCTYISVDLNENCLEI